MHIRTDREGRFRLDEIDPGKEGWIVASWRDPDTGTHWLAPATPLAGRLEAGRVTVLDVLLEEQSRVALTIEFLGWRAGLEIADDDGLSWFDCPRVRSETELSGRHRFRLRESADLSERAKRRAAEMANDIGIRVRVPRGALNAGLPVLRRSLQAEQ